MPIPLPVQPHQLTQKNAEEGHPGGVFRPEPSHIYRPIHRASGQVPTGQFMHRLGERD